MIRIEHVSKTFIAGKKKLQALTDVSLHVKEGEIFGVIGYSGAGKSTLLRLVNGLEQADQGQVLVAGEELAALDRRSLNRTRRNIGMIFQQFHLLESQSVYRNVALPLILAKTRKEEIAARVKTLLAFVGLEEKSQVYASQLSGGQKQRVAIARALATEPKILLCDEATSALDPQTTEAILALLQRINRELGITILLITHEMAVIQKICHRVAVMQDGQICEQGSTVALFRQPREQITRNFVSTVMHDQIPPSLLAELEANSTVIKITFFGENSREALVARINKQYQIETTILFAAVHELQGSILGIVILQLKGAAAEIKRAEQYIAQQEIKMERMVIAHG